MQLRLLVGSLACHGQCEVYETKRSKCCTIKAWHVTPKLTLDRGNWLSKKKKFNEAVCLVFNNNIIHICQAPINWLYKHNHSKIKSWCIKIIVFNMHMYVAISKMWSVNLKICIVLKSPMRLALECKVKQPCGNPLLPSRLGQTDLG
jgi:hypothetical protein